MNLFGMEVPQILIDYFSHLLMGKDAPWIQNNEMLVYAVDWALTSLAVYAIYYFSKRQYLKENWHLPPDRIRKEYRSFEDWKNKPSYNALQRNPHLLLDEEYLNKVIGPEPAYDNPGLDQALRDCTMLRSALEKTARAMCARIDPDDSARIEKLLSYRDQDMIFNELWAEYQDAPQNFSAGDQAVKKHMQDYVRFFGHLKNEAKRLNLSDIEYNQVYVHSSLAKLNDAFLKFVSPPQIG